MKKKLSKEEDTTRILARTECLILWDDLARTGDIEKYDTIKSLYKEGKLNKGGYKCECPFCDYFEYEDGNFGLNCDICIWPGRGDVRCIRCNTPFFKWEYSKDRKDRKKYAKEMVKFILSIDI